MAEPRSVEEIAKDAAQTQEQAQELMENVARGAIRSELRDRGLNEARLSDAEIDTFAEGITALPDDR